MGHRGKHQGQACENKLAPSTRSPALQNFKGHVLYNEELKM